jgi:hypothetical protein
MSTWNLCSKAVFLVSKLVFFAISLDAIHPEFKMVSLCDTHWGNFNKFAKIRKNGQGSKG